MSSEFVWNPPGVAPVVENSPTVFQDFLNREVRTGSWQDLSKGTFAAACEAVERGQNSEAVALLKMSLLEAEELREVYEAWPKEILDWVRAHQVSANEIDVELSRLNSLIGQEASRGIEENWHKYSEAVDFACALIERGDDSIIETIEGVRQTWQVIHDGAVDRVAGLIDIAVRQCGEESLLDLWNFLLRDWYAVHASRYSLENQPWSKSAHQLMVSIVDGFHAHLAGADRQGDIEIIHEADRMGFRFAPCGSGGRAVDAGITGGQPRSAAPFNFAVTEKKHDWAWNKLGICSYCVHCCLLNEVMPIDRIGFPTRVIDPPVWSDQAVVAESGGRSNTSCTWWIYRDPSLVPEEIYRRVGRVKPQQIPGAAGQE